MDHVDFLHKGKHPRKDEADYWNKIYRENFRLSDEFICFENDLKWKITVLRWIQENLVMVSMLLSYS